MTDSLSHDASAVKLTAIQLCSVPNVSENLAQIDEQLSKASDVNPSNVFSNSGGVKHHLVVLPECCLFFGGKDKQQLELAQNAEQVELMLSGLADIAKRYQCYLVAGSLPLMPSAESERFVNASVMFSPKGEIVAQYEKLHLFDVEVDDNEKSYRESTYTQAGQRIQTTQLPFAGVGLSICYDLRFPELYRQLAQAGASIITVPAAFTRPTGVAHWQALLQARAIENQAYIIASGQEGIHANGRETWGHSMIISPWGEILAQLPTGVGSISADYDDNLVQQIRKSMPVAAHNRFKTELIHD